MKRDENEIIATLYECSQVSISENPSCHNCKYKIVDDDDFPESCYHCGRVE